MTINNTIIFFALLLAGCSSTQKDQAVREDKLLAQVYDKSLYLSELDGMIPGGSSVEDSALIVNAYIERWVRESLMMHEAEMNISQDLNIDKLVRNYRSSLVRHHYEKILLELELDSTILQSELSEFYEQNKNQYQLNAPILRCHFIKVDKPVQEESQVKGWWKSKKLEDRIKLIEYSNRYAVIHLLEDSTWYKIEDISAQLPDGTLTVKNVRSKKEFILSDDNFLYFFRMLEYMPENSIAPLKFVEEQAKKAILHKRKLEFLNRKKEEMYERELGKKNVKIYSK